MGQWRFARSSTSRGCDPNRRAIWDRADEPYRRARAVRTCLPCEPRIGTERGIYPAGTPAPQTLVGKSRCPFANQPSCGLKSALVCPAGADSIGMRVSDGVDDGNRSQTASEKPRGSKRKSRRQTLDCRNTNRQRGREQRASRRAQAKPNSHQTGLCRA